MNYDVRIFRQHRVDAEGCEMDFIASFGKESRERKIGVIHSAGLDEVAGYEELKTQ